MKKTWIKLKRGVLDPKHVRAVGPALWLFCLMIDAADWNTGVVRAWTDRQAAEDLGINPSTARDWRQRLVKYGYIECKHVGQAQDVQIHNWTNPREYSGEVTHKANTIPADVADGWEPDKGSVQTEQLDAGRSDRSVEGSVEGSVRAERPFLKTTSHIPQGESKDQTPWVQVLAILKRGMSREEFDTWIAPTELLSLSGDALTVACGNSYGLACLENGHRAEIEAAVREVLGRPLQVRFVVAQVAA